MAHLRRLSRASGLPVQQLVRICVDRALPYTEAFVRDEVTKPLAKVLDKKGKR